MSNESAIVSLENADIRSEAILRELNHYKTKCALYEKALSEIASITKAESPLEHAAEMFFLIASRMRRIAKMALNLTENLFVDNQVPESKQIEHNKG